jgi:hypothetical protein
MHHFFTLSPQFEKWKYFIYTIYIFAVLDIITTFLTVWTGGMEINPFGAQLFNNPVLFASWRLAIVTILIVFPYKFSERFNPASVAWLALLGAMVFPVANNLIMLTSNLLFYI